MENERGTALPCSSLANASIRKVVCAHSYGKIWNDEDIRVGSMFLQVDCGRTRQIFSDNPNFPFILSAYHC